VRKSSRECILGSRRNRTRIISRRRSRITWSFSSRGNKSNKFSRFGGRRTNRFSRFTGRKTNRFSRFTERKSGKKPTDPFTELGRNISG